MWSKIFQLILSLPSIISGIERLVKAILDLIKERQQKKRSDKIEEAVEEYKKPRQTKEEASSAACKIEKTLNPNSDCDRP